MHIFRPIRPSRLRMVLFVIVLAAFGISVAYYTFAASRSALAATPGPGGLISRGAPAYASSGTPSRANDTDFNTTWRSSGASSWLAYDLSGIAAARRASVLLVWYNEATDNYNPVLLGAVGVDYPLNYAVELNAAAGGGAVPATGWVTGTAVSGNVYHSREHVVNMSGYNWVRLKVTAVNGLASDINMDVYSAAEGLAGGWMFYGSSTPALAMNHRTLSGVKSFSDLFNQSRPHEFPVQENGSIGGLDSGGGVNYINTWLPLFPGKYVVIALGANDARTCMNPTTFYDNMSTMIKAVDTAGKIPVIPFFNWSPSADACGLSIVTQINKIYATYPQVIKGPDFWTYFKAHPTEVSGDQIHPTTQGLANYRQMWAQVMLKNVPPNPVVSLAGDVNGDGVVNVFDLSILLSHWNAAYAPADFDNDGKISVFDLSILVSHWTG